MKTYSYIFIIMVPGLAQAGGCSEESKPQQPNIVVIISDDAGYADFSMHGLRQFSTPNIDAIAKNGIRFSQGYVSASVCSPSRAGLLTGRYQQRFGHELNIPPAYSEVNGLPRSEVLISNILKTGGYRTIALGKWHLGYAPHFHPLSRGFDDYYGFLQGARPYRPVRGTRLNRLLRDRDPVRERFTYLTDELGKEAAAYIGKHKKKPFFMYLAFNAVHTPMQAKAEDIAKFKHIPRKKRQTLAAMTKSLDEAVGTVVSTLKKENLLDNTLLVFINDNGGAKTNGSKNLPLRGAKGSPFEGGIRVPFLMQWPAKLPKGKVFDFPVISLDILPTAMAAAGIEAKLKKPLDGVDLLPYLTGRNKERPHQTLYWRKGDNMAIRDGDWKLLRHQGGMPLLFDLAKDGSEETDLAAKQPDKVKALQKKYSEWESQLVEPLWRRARKKKKTELSTVPIGLQQKPKQFKPDRQEVYRKAGKVSLKMHIFEPKGHKPTDRRAAIVFFFGGGWIGGSPSQFYPHCAHLAEKGMVAMAAGYRVRSRHKTTPFDCVEDGKAAIRWVREHAKKMGIDPSRIAAGGGSAGGHVAAATGTVPGLDPNPKSEISARPNALVLFNPVYDNGPKGYGYNRVKDRYKEISPLHNISETTPPAIVFLGTKDKLIPVSTAQSFQKKMKEAGVKSELMLFPDEPHGFFNYGRGDGSNYRKTVEAMDGFLKALGFLK